MAQILQCVEHWLQMRSSLFYVKLVRKCFQVYVGGVHARIEFPTRGVVHIPCRNCDSLDSALVTSIRDIHCILCEDHRIVVGESNALTAATLRGGGDLFRP